MNDLSFRLPDNFPSARSLLLIATSAPLDHQPPVRRPPYPRFHATELPLPRPHRAMLLEEIRRTIIPDSGHRVDGSITRFFMKLAAVRSGLAQYGRSNICYVEGMGSFFHSTPT